MTSIDDLRKKKRKEKHVEEKLLLAESMSLADNQRLLDQSASSEEMGERKGTFKKKTDPRIVSSKNKPQCNIL